MKGQKKYSVTQYADKLKVTRQAILARILRGTLNAEKIGETYVIIVTE